MFYVKREYYVLCVKGLNLLTSLYISTLVIFLAAVFEILQVFNFRLDIPIIWESAIQK